MTYRSMSTLAILPLLLAVAGCGGDGGAGEVDTAAVDAPEGAEQALPFPKLEQHIWRLASDEFEGRKPASPGEEKTVNYIADQFRAIGVGPGNGDSYFQEVPLSVVTGDGKSRLQIRGDGYSRELAFRDEMMVWTTRMVEEITVDQSELVFVGYGIVAPEYDWDDYAGVNVKGKTVVILVNDPGYATGDEALFRGNTMTYYGRWTYKYEEAARQGAAGALIVHETGAAGYGWEIVANSWTGQQFGLVADDGNMSRVAAEGWLTRPVAEEIFTAAGADLDELAARAATREFRAQPLGLTMSVAIANELGQSESRNVVGVLHGSERPDEYVLYMAHWDHLGRDPSLVGDQIYNGAVDNASGVAGLIVLAEKFAAATPPPERSILFLAVTAEEAGLLGSEYFGAHPLVPLRSIVAGINMDGLNVSGRMRDVVVIGYGSSELEEYLAEAAEGQGRYTDQEPTPEKGFFYRSDHFNLAKLGVPMLYAESGVDSVEHGGREWGLARQAEYTEKRYHQVTDEFDETWDLSGAREDLALYYQIGRRIASEQSFPNWYEGTEFRAIRDRSRGE